MEVRNLSYTAEGKIDCEYNHPALGWIPFTADAGDVEQLGKDIHAAALAGQFGAVAAYVAPPPLPPQVPVAVSRFQAKVALDAWQLLDDVEVMMADPATPLVTRLAWADAQEFRRDSPIVLAMAQALGLTPAQLDELFIYAGGVVA